MRNGIYLWELLNGEDTSVEKMS